MVDPNTPSTELTAMRTYAQNAPQEYMIPPGGVPAMEQPEYQNGVIPLDTLPAAWWNWLLYTITEQEKRMVRFFNSIFNEFRNLLTTGGIQSFDETVNNQLVTAIQAITCTPATTQTAGAIKAGTAYGTLAVDGTTGVATMNGAGTGQFNTIAQNITDAINELDSDIGTEANNRTSADNILQNNIDGKAPINHASTTTDYGVGNATNYGHVKLSDSYTETTPGTASEGMAASQKALQDGLNSIVAIQANVPTGTVFPFAGVRIPMGYLLCNGSPVSRITYAALFTALGGTDITKNPWGQGDGSTTFNVPDLRETVPVGVGSSNREAYQHDVYTLGQFKDDQVAQHAHNVYVRDIGHHHTVPEGSAIWPYNRGSDGVAHEARATGVVTGDSSAVIQVNASPNFDGSWNSTSTTGKSGGTHGKRLGMNYIIKY